MSAFCLDCQNNVHFQCARPCNCRCTIEHLIEHTTHNNVLVNTADVRHAPRIYTELEERQANRDLRDAMHGRRKYADESLGVTPWWYRLRKSFGKAAATASVINTARSIEQLP
jgi:hypothetical protein